MDASALWPPAASVVPTGLNATSFAELSVMPSTVLERLATFHTATSPLTSVVARRRNGVYLHVHFWARRYRGPVSAMIRVLHPDYGLPEGRSHTSGATERGHLVSVIWDSKDQSEDFMRTHSSRRCRWRAAGSPGLPEERTTDVAHHDEI